MNPAFYIIVAITVVVVWLCCVSIFKEVGQIVYELFTSIKEQFEEEEEEE